MDYKTVIDYTKDKVDSIYKVIDIFEVTLSSKVVKIKILKGVNGTFCYRNSHWYYGPEQAGPFISSINCFDTEGEALLAAIRELTLYYKPEHKGKSWIENSEF